jgi:Domain of unknown function (DUF4290)
MHKIEIEYNSNREPIKYPEYGRGIQELLIHACTIENPRLRQKTVESIVGMMLMLNPNHRGIEDYRDRLWNHAFAIADYQLDVVPPPGVLIRRESDKPPIEPMEYPKPNLRFRHYGSSVQKLIAKAIEMPEGPKREGFVEVIASYMKLAYKTWSKEHYVSDDIVKEDLENLSNGQLLLHEGHNSLDTLAFHAGLRDREMQRMQQNRKKSSGGGSANNKRGKRSSGGGSGSYRKSRKT